MNIRLYIYNDEIGWARLTINGVEHIAADCRTSGYRKIEKTLEITTSHNTDAKEGSNRAMLGMCERDVKQGYAAAIDLEVEPIDKDWKEWGISHTVVPFDYERLVGLCPQE